MIATLLAIAAAATPPLRCGAVERPGIAERGEDGIWRGVAIDLCRQVARGKGATIAFHPYRRVDDLREAEADDLAVLTRAELAIARPAANPLATPVAVSRQVLLVTADSRLRSPAQLAGRRTCFMIGSAAESELNAWARRTGIAIQRVGFQETVELRDGFDSGFCTAMAVDAADVPGGSDHTRALGPPLAELPVFVIMQHGAN